MIVGVGGGADSWIFKRGGDGIDGDFASDLYRANRWCIVMVVAFGAGDLPGDLSR